ncbi:hypothetical protein [Paeniclostridium hominis]|uniref:hypothetical protein n=1 Tax=Paeniclostridium hominis TaxID=2764329 RepID=UPI0022E69C2C|nr:hypothetical protein [Paeniclostridium hominis]
MNLKKIKKIMKIVGIIFFVFGLALLAIVWTVGEANESLQPTITIVVKRYTYFVIFIAIINCLLKYIDRHRNKKYLKISDK